MGKKEVALENLYTEGILTGRELEECLNALKHVNVEENMQDEIVYDDDDVLDINYDCDNNIYEKMEIIKQYINENGNMPPVTYIDANGNKIGQWVASIISRIKIGTITDEEILLFEKRNVQFGIRPLYWYEWYRLLRKYLQEMETSYIPESYIESDIYLLGRWAKRQVRGFNSLSNNRKKYLLKLNWDEINKFRQLEEEKTDYEIWFAEEWKKAVDRITKKDIDDKYSLISEKDSKFAREWDSVIKHLRKEKIKKIKSIETMRSKYDSVNGGCSMYSSIYMIYLKEFGRYKTFLSENDIEHLARKTALYKSEDEYNKNNNFNIIIELIYQAIDNLCDYIYGNVDSDRIMDDFEEVLERMISEVGYGKRVGKFFVTEFAEKIYDRLLVVDDLSSYLEYSELLSDMEHLVFRVCCYFGEEYEKIGKGKIYIKKEQAMQKNKFIKMEIMKADPLFFDDYDE